MANQTLIKTAASLLMNNGTYPTRDTIFDPFRYEFDAETMIEPFTYFQYVFVLDHDVTSTPSF